MTNELDRQHLSNNELMELEATLASSPPSALDTRLLLAKEWLAKEALAYAERGIEIRSASAAASKAAYHEANPGARFYEKHNHKPQDVAGGETAEDYKKRTHRDRQRLRRGVTTVRAYNPNPTPEDRAAQVRAARKRHNEKKKAEKTAALAARAIV